DPLFGKRRAKRSLVCERACYGLKYGRHYCDRSFCIRYFFDIDSFSLYRLCCRFCPFCLAAFDHVCHAASYNKPLLANRRLGFAGRADVCRKKLDREALERAYLQSADGGGCRTMLSRHLECIRLLQRPVLLADEALLEWRRSCTASSCSLQRGNRSR